MDLERVKGKPLKVEFTIDNLAKSINYIPLEECVSLQGVSKLEASPDCFFLMNNKQLFQFGKTGKFIRQFASDSLQFSCSDFDIDIEKLMIYALDYQRKDIVKFNFSGDFIERYKNPIARTEGVVALASVNYLKCMGAGKLLIANNSHTEVPETFLYDENTRELKQIQGNKATTPSGTDLSEKNKLFYFYNGQLYGKHMFSDTVYQYTREGKAKPTYVVQDGKLAIKIKDLSFKKSLKQKVLISNILESSLFVMIFYQYFIDEDNQKLYMAYYDKANPYPYDSFYLINFFSETSQELFNKNNFTDRGTYKIKNSRIDGSSNMFLAKDGFLYQVRPPSELSEKRKAELHLTGINNPCVIRYEMNKTLKAYLENLKR